MPIYLVDLWLDGYNSEEEMKKACDIFIDEQLDITASSLRFERVTEDSEKSQINQFKKFVRGC